MGFVSVGKDYVLNATRLIQEKFSDQKLNFILLGEDFDWNLKNFQKFPEFEKKILPPNKNPAVDLCVLSKCDHVIMTTGTFGWWGGYLSGGTVIYSKTYFRKDSPMERINIPARDFFPEDWIGI